MTAEANEAMDFSLLKEEIGTEVNKKYKVRSRGRPQTPQAEKDRKNGRRMAFGAKLKKMREEVGMTLAAAADAAGIASARKLSQYETTCYPPGWVVEALAPVYGVDAKYLSALVIAHSDPDMFTAIAGNITPEEFADIPEEGEDA